MDVPRVSVIVPAHNAANTIGRCLDSLASQTLAGMEIVVVDDGSDDSTAQVVSTSTKGSRLPLRLVSTSHGGRAAARNVGLREARGEFLGFVDADDYAEADMFERLLGCAEETGADMVACEYESFDASSGVVIHHYREGDSSLYGASVAERPALLLQIGASLCNKLVRASLFAEGGISFPEGLDFEDLATTYRLAAQARRIEKVSAVLYHYRQGHASSVMSACDERYLQIPEALRTTNEHFAKAGLMERVRGELEAVNFIHLIGGRFEDLFGRGCRSVRHEFVRRAFDHMDRYFPGWKTDASVRRLQRPAKHLVSTNRLLLTLYGDLASGRR